MQWVRRRAFMLVAVVASLLSPTVALAQSGGLTGRIVDDSGAGVPGARVGAWRVGATTEAAQAVTGADGRYSLAGLAAGRYVVAARAPGFAEVRRAGVEVAAAPVVIDLRLPLAISADVVVTGSRTFGNLADVADPRASVVGVARAASEGAVTGAQIQSRAIMRPGEVIEAVPGVVISQHSGEGKANQYYLRGFNLDHGTDFATTVAGVPVNLPTHAHGHGYSDANFLIPELVSGIQFRKGPYFADTGDFSAAGAAQISYVNRLDRPIVSASAGEHGWARLFAAASTAVGADAHVLLGVEAGSHDGPWTRPDAARRLNAVARYSRGAAHRGLVLTAQVYRNTWYATDQVPQRAIDSGLITRFGSFDGTTGGTTARDSLALEYQRGEGDSVTRVSAFGLRYRLNLFSNFTYALDDQERGDQFEQADRRIAAGGRVSHRRVTRIGNRAAEFAIGGELRHDDIPTVGLYRTRARERVDVVREDAVRQTSAALSASMQVALTPWLRASGGLRADGYRFAVDAGNPINGGTERAGLISPKGGLVFGPWARTEFYVNAGHGFHSNDARGATMTRDPSTGERAARVTPLVKARGVEAGFRTIALPRTQITVAAWRLALDSELLFVGDAGTTEPGRPSDRHGIEVSAYTRLTPHLVADADIAWSRARFADQAPEGRLIPGSLETVVAAGLALEDWRRLSASARLRHFGPRPLIEDGSIRSRATTLVNLRAAVRLTDRLSAGVDVFNLFDRRVSDIDYYYVSRLAGEPAEGVADIHTHPALPRTARATLTIVF